MKTIAFVGNPNVGKSAWINALSDAKFKVGNWAGVTVSIKYAQVVWEDKEIQLIDLPGTYTLQNQENEEGITARYLQEETIDLIINIVDATNLAANFSLTLALRRLQIPMLLLFNFMDEVEKYHMHMDFLALENILQIPILAYSAFDKEGVKYVQQAILHASSKVAYQPLIASVDVESYSAFVHVLERHFPSYIQLSKIKKEWFFYDAYIGKEEVLQQIQAWHLDLTKQEDCEEVQRYRCIQELMDFVDEGDDRYQKTKRMDHFLLHPLYGKLCLLGVFVFMMVFVFQGSAPFNDFIDFLIQDLFIKYIRACIFFLPESAQHLLIDGVVAGVGGVLVFLPLMAFLNFFLSMIEESGYMARMAFLLDPYMQHFHLSGKSFVALLLGFGCNVPAIYATRTLDNEKQRRLTSLLIPFMSCGARLPVYMVFAAAFFSKKAVWMILSIYGIGIFVALLLACLSSHIKAFHDEDILLIALPPYRRPNASVVFHKVKEEVQGYLKKATSVVLWAMIALWCLSYFPSGNLNTSYLAQFAKKVAPIYEPLGFGTRWESVAALPGSIVAKETVVGFLGQVLQKDVALEETKLLPMEDAKQILYEAGVTFKRFFSSFLPTIPMDSQEDALVSKLATFWQDDLANLRAYCYMVYILLSIPCVMTLFAIKKECGWKTMMLSIFLMLVIPYILTFLIFQFFSLVL